MPVGYSDTPLVRKLGIGEGTEVVVKHEPANYKELLHPIPDNVAFECNVSGATDVVHIFVDRRAARADELMALRAAIRVNTAIWVSWPKKASKLPTDITEDEIRKVALPLGLVDVKVCAVSEIWSGLKLVIRKELR